MAVEKLEVNSPLGSKAIAQEGAPALSVYDIQWEATFELYKAFKAEYGREPLVSESYHGCRLGAWCNTQRVCYKTGMLYDDRLEKLVSVGFVFELYEKAWHDSFRAYVTFRVERGREPSFSGGPDEKNLAQWCMVQRRAYKNKTLLVEREQLLLDAGFVFHKRETRWQKNFNLYLAFKAEHGREPKVNDVYCDENLGLWCRTQRQAYRNGKLAPEHLQTLLDAAFDFERKRSFRGSLEDKLVDATERSGTIDDFGFQLDDMNLA